MRICDARTHAAQPRKRSRARSLHRLRAPSLLARARRPGYSVRSAVKCSAVVYTHERERGVAREPRSRRSGDRGNRTRTCWPTPTRTRSAGAGVAVLRTVLQGQFAQSGVWDAASLAAFARCGALWALRACDHSSDVEDYSLTHSVRKRGAHGQHPCTHTLTEPRDGPLLLALLGSGSRGGRGSATLGSGSTLASASSGSSGGGGLLVRCGLAWHVEDVVGGWKIEK